MIFRQLFDSTSSTYTYLIGDEQSGSAALIDPVAEHTNRYIKLLGELGLKLVIAADTHTHADHITALGALRDKTGCKTLIGQQSGSECASATFTDGDILMAGSIAITALHTPGHTDDSYSFYIDDATQPILFTGDTLLIRGTGRTDFQNGNAAEQYHSLFERLLKLPGHTLVYPGHDYNGNTVSTIDEEKNHNPRLQIADQNQYIELMNNLDLPNPAMMDVAVPANRACGNPTV